MLAGQVDDWAISTVTDCLVTILVLPVTPWGCVLATYPLAPRGGPLFLQDGLRPAEDKEEGMTTLQFDPGSPWWLHLGAALILYAHIIGGSIGIISGAAAMTLRKGSRPHALAGHWFFGSMLVMAAVGGLVSPFTTTPEGEREWFNAVAGFFTLYLVATAWMTVRRKPGTIGRFEGAAFAYATALAAAAAWFSRLASASPSGTLSGYAGMDYAVAAVIIGLAALLDLNLIRRGGIKGIPRITRHLWRMCIAMFIAVGSFFIGQQRNMPVFMQDSPALLVPPLATLALTGYWLLKPRVTSIVRLAARRRTTATSPGQGAAAAEP